MNFLRLASPIFAHGRSSNLPLRAKTKERRRKKKTLPSSYANACIE